MMKKYGKLIISLIVFIVLAIATTISFAYFSANVIQNNINDNVITSGNMEITYDDGNGIQFRNNVLPGNSIYKWFIIKNTGTVDAYFDVYLVDVINTFNTESDLVYSISSYHEAASHDIIMPHENTKIMSNVFIKAGDTYTYQIEVEFKETNQSQDDNQGAVFSAKISLENKDNLLATTIINKKREGDPTLEYDGYAHLGIKTTTDNNLRYVGTNPNNYIYYNCDTTNPDEMNDETCEKWRMIGVLNNVINKDGESTSRVKIIRDESLGYYVYDTSDSSVNGGYGINQWGESTYTNGDPYEGADLMRELNTDYLGNITVGTDGKWYNGSNNSKTNMPSKMLSASAVDMIEEVKWNLGAYNRDYIKNNVYPAYDAEKFEKQSVYHRSCSGGFACNDTVNRDTTWYGKVGLISGSDYIFSISGNETVSKNKCLSSNQNYWNYTIQSDDTSIGDCHNTTWLYERRNTMTINPYDHNVGNMLTVLYTDGGLSTNSADVSTSIKPVLYLKNETKIVDGDGTTTNPYKLVLNN